MTSKTKLPPQGADNDKWIIEIDNRVNDYQFDQAAKEAFEAEMFRWLLDNGTPELKQALNLGYEIKGAYVRERAKAELPGFYHDGGGHIELRGRANPTPEAIRLAAQVKQHLDDSLIEYNVAGIAYAARGLDDRFCDSAEPVVAEMLDEVIFVAGYLGRGQMILPVDLTQALRRCLSGWFSLVDISIAPMQATRILADEEPNPRMQHALTQIAQSLEEGKTLSESAKETGAFPDSVTAVFEAGEETGQLHESFRLAKELTK
jgi:hypothetical protein